VALSAAAAAVTTILRERTYLLSVPVASAVGEAFAKINKKFLADGRAAAAGPGNITYNVAALNSVGASQAWIVSTLEERTWLTGKGQNSALTAPVFAYRIRRWDADGESVAASDSEMESSFTRDRGWHFIPI
jgi:hypothetical protein